MWRVIAYLWTVGVAISILINALLGGRKYQTTCARLHNLRFRGIHAPARIADALLGDGHCYSDWCKWQQTRGYYDTE